MADLRLSEVDADIGSHLSGAQEMLEKPFSNEPHILKCIHPEVKPKTIPIFTAKYSTISITIQVMMIYRSDCSRSQVVVSVNMTEV